jgi:FAD-dependent oxidoreductase domain-containing protein 1
LTPEQLKAKFPWLNLDGIALGSFGESNEGYFDPWSLLCAMKAKARSMGVEYVDGAAVDAEVKQNGISSYDIESIIVDVKGTNGNTKERFSGAKYVNAAGSWSPQVIRFLSQRCPNPAAIAQLPIERRKRSIFCVHSTPQEGVSGASPLPPKNAPLVIDTTGVYFRPEKSLHRYITGVSPPEDLDRESSADSDLEHTDHKIFDETLWPTLYDRIPAFDRLKVVSYWSGFYDYNIVDQVSVSSSFALINSLHEFLVECHYRLPPSIQGSNHVHGIFRTRNSALTSLWQGCYGDYYGR